MSTMTNVLQVQTRGIHHGLPVFGEDDARYQNLTAIVTGANGISGHYMLRALGQSPHRWKKIYCLSRRPPAQHTLPATAEHVALDFMEEPEEIARKLKKHGIKADYVFFFSYVQPGPIQGKGLWSDADEMVRVNVILLKNFVAALAIASIVPRRFMLQTGAKFYGTHLGPTRVPQEESDPRVTLEANFYYPQEDALFAWCKEHATSWNTVMPSFILGAVPDAAMNAAYPLAVYAAVCAHSKKALVYPSDLNSWTMTQVASSAMINAYLEEWAVLTENAKDQRFNACDGSPFAWEKTWPRVAAWYGIEYEGPSFDDSAYAERTTPYDPPPRGYGPPAKVRTRFSMTAWAKEPEVVQAWRELAIKHNLVDQELRDVDRVFAFLDGMICRSAPVNFSMDKARKLGWHGFVDSNESLLEVFDDLAKLKMIPPVPKVNVVFN